MSRSRTLQPQADVEGVAEVDDEAAEDGVSVLSSPRMHVGQVEDVLEGEAPTATSDVAMRAERASAA